MGHLYHYRVRVLILEMLDVCHKKKRLLMFSLDVFFMSVPAGLSTRQYPPRQLRLHFAKDFDWSKNMGHFCNIYKIQECSSCAMYNNFNTIQLSVKSHALLGLSCTPHLMDASSSSLLAVVRKVMKFY
jgi:hypothetical protein